MIESIINLTFFSDSACSVYSNSSTSVSEPVWLWGPFVDGYLPMCKEVKTSSVKRKCIKARRAHFLRIASPKKYKVFVSMNISVLGNMRHNCVCVFPCAWYIFAQEKSWYISACKISYFESLSV